MESGPVLHILGKMHFDVMHEQYKNANELQVVGHKSQRRQDNVQGKNTNDQTSVVIEICEKVTQRYRTTPAIVLINLSEQTHTECILPFS